MHTPPITSAIVDLDGTLVDTLPDFVAALAQVSADLQLPVLSAPDIEPMVGKGSEHLIATWLAQAGAPSERFDAAWASYRARYRAMNGVHATVYPGVVEGLGMLRASGLRIACLTNKPSDFAHDLLARKDLARFFDVVFGGDAFERKKPDPLPMLRTCEALRSAPAETLAIGDSSNDAQSARAAGCRVVLVTYGYNHGQDVHAVPADAHVESIAQAAERFLRPRDPAALP